MTRRIKLLVLKAEVIVPARRLTHKHWYGFPHVPVDSTAGMMPPYVKEKLDRLSLSSKEEGAGGMIHWLVSRLSGVIYCCAVAAMFLGQACLPVELLLRRKLY